MAISPLTVLSSRRKWVFLLGLVLLLPFLFNAYGRIRQRDPVNEPIVWTAEFRVDLANPAPGEDLKGIDPVLKEEDPADWPYHTDAKVQPFNPAVSSLSQNTFAHTDFYHAPEPRTRLNFCGRLSEDDINSLAASLMRPIDPVLPLAYHLQDGELVTAEHNAFPVGTGFCSVLLIPQMPWRKHVSFQDLPVEGMGPDGVHVQVASPDVRLVMTEQPDFWGFLTLGNGWAREPVEMAVYLYSYSLLQPGSYQLDGELEYESYRWLLEEPIDMNHVFHKYEMDNIKISPQSPPMAVVGNPVARPLQLCYRNGYNDVRGRWYRAEAFRERGNQTRLNARAKLDYAEHPATVDDWGWTFAPDECTLAYFDAEDHLSCFENRTIHVIGDSNARRVMKAIISGGETWCPGDDLTDRVPQCEDRRDVAIHDPAGNDVNITLLHDPTIARLEPITWGRGSKLFLDFVGGVVRSAIMNPWFLYLEGKSDPDDDSDNSPLSIVAQRHLDHGPTDVVLVSLVTWDVSHLLTPAETLARLPDFRDKLMRSYPAMQPRYMIRLANGNCCGNFNNRSRFSQPRFQMWNTAYREFWAEDVHAGRAQFTDASVLQGRLEAERAYRCPQMHLKCSHVRLEAQMLMNSVCEKHWNGTASLRDW